MRCCSGCIYSKKLKYRLKVVNQGNLEWAVSIPDDDGVAYDARIFDMSVRALERERVGRYSAPKLVNNRNSI